MNDLISRQAAIDVVTKHYRAFDNDLLELIAYEMEHLPSAQPEERTEERTETRACDCISRQMAIDAMEDVDWYHINKDGQLTHGANSKEDEPLYKAEDVYKVLNDMPSAQPELSHTQKSCEYCHEDSDGYVKPIEKNCHAYVNRGFMGWHIVLKARGWMGEAKINFCPMCGRELNR